MKRICPALCAGACLTALAGCEPGFLYVIPGAPTIQSNGLRSLVDVGNGLEARFHANVFTNSGTVDVEVVNRSEDRVEFRFAPAEISYGRGKPVHKKRCEGFPAEPIAIPRGTTIAVRCQFAVDEFEGRQYSRDYRFLYVELPGFSRNGAPLKIAATMEWSY